MDQDKKPVQGVTFKVNNEETKPTGFDGKVNIAEKDVTEAGIDTYKITEVKASAEYYTLKDAITINVKTERENGEFVITKAYFDNDEKATTKKAMLEDGKTEVELTIT